MVELFVIIYVLIIVKIGFDSFRSLRYFNVLLNDEGIDIDDLDNFHKFLIFIVLLISIVLWPALLFLKKDPEIQERIKQIMKDQEK